MERYERIKASVDQKRQLKHLRNKEALDQVAAMLFFDDYRKAETEARRIAAESAPKRYDAKRGEYFTDQSYVDKEAEKLLSEARASVNVAFEFYGSNSDAMKAAANASISESLFKEIYFCGYADRALRSGYVDEIKKFVADPIKATDRMAEKIITWIEYGRDAA